MKSISLFLGLKEVKLELLISALILSQVLAIVSGQVPLNLQLLPLLIQLSHDPVHLLPVNGSCQPDHLAAADVLHTRAQLSRIVPLPGV